MTNEILVLNDLTTFSEFKYSYDELVENNELTDMVLVDSDALNIIIALLEKIYANNLMLLFIMSCASSLYICSARRKKDYIMINNVEPKLLKGTVNTSV
jgi:hypothetical protein